MPYRSIVFELYSFVRPKLPGQDIHEPGVNRTSFAGGTVVVVVVVFVVAIISIPIVVGVTTTEVRGYDFEMLYSKERPGFFLTDGSSELGGVLVQRFAEIFDKRLHDSVDTLLGIPHLIGKKEWG